jgi:hypothetical protein
VWARWRISNSCQAIGANNPRATRSVSSVSSCRFSYAQPVFRHLKNS